MKWSGSAKRKLQSISRTDLPGAGRFLPGDLLSCFCPQGIQLLYMFQRRYLIVLYLLLPALWLSSCATYNKQASSYYTYLRQGDYAKAATALDANKLLNKSRNRLLYLLERGKICHLLHQWDSSNTYLNEADHMIEDASASAKDLTLGTLINPMMQSYRAESFEKYLVHYYKALNYLQLAQPQEALVEARRISLQTYAQQDKAGKNKYAEDAFALMLQGLIYERNNDINNAFIAYRNAVDLYLDNSNSYYGTSIPVQLKKDLLRTAQLNGFADELGRYERLLNITYTPEAAPEGGELILFWETGAAPVKIQQDLYFSLIKNADGAFFFTDAGGFYNVPYDMNNGYNANNIKLEDLRSFRVALPQYQERPLLYTGASLSVNGASFTLEPVENISNLALATLKERMLKELSSALTRLAIKKLAEAAVRPPERKNNKEMTEEEKKKQEKKDNAREAIAMGIQLLSFATEKADTRNWQSLPHSIFYARIPLQKGVNNLLLNINGSGGPAISIQVNGVGGMQFTNVCTLK